MLIVEGASNIFSSLLIVEGESNNISGCLQTWISFIHREYAEIRARLVTRVFIGLM
jgi:hypothetical protein